MTFPPPAAAAFALVAGLTALAPSHATPPASAKPVVAAPVQPTAKPAAAPPAQPAPAPAAKPASAAAGTSAPAARPSPASDTGGSALRQHVVHVAYNDGDFDKVLQEIETFTKANKTYSRADSIFIAKHLSVVYTANPDTRERGKYYMYRLLEMLPSAELVDMFVSDEIDRIFDKVRKEFLARQRAFGVDVDKLALPERPGYAAPAPGWVQVQAAPPPPPPPPPPLWKRKGFWLASGAGLAAVGAWMTYSHLDVEDDPEVIRLRGETDR